MEYVRAHGVEKKYMINSKVLGVPAVEIGKSTSNHPLHRAPATTQVTKNFGLVQDLGRLKPTVSRLAGLGLFAH
jgi:hypothetical protein